MGLEGSLISFLDCISGGVGDHFLSLSLSLKLRRVVDGLVDIVSLLDRYPGGVYDQKHCFPFSVNILGD